MIHYPLYYPMPEGPLELQGRIQQLELALSMSLELFQKLAERLEARLGPDFLGEELGRFATAATTAQDEVRALQRITQLRRQCVARWGKALQIGIFHS